jgi:hypothetical protein
MKRYWMVTKSTALKIKGNQTVSHISLLLDTQALNEA